MTHLDPEDRLGSLPEHTRRYVTHPALAERVGIHVTQVRRYEAGASAPTLDVLRNIAITSQADYNFLVFDKDERSPDDDVRLAFEATIHLDPDERVTVKQLIEAMILKHEAKRWAS